MLKQVMNNNKPKFYILFCILCITQLTSCKVAHRRDDAAGTKEEKENLNAADGSQEDQPNLLETADGADKQQQTVNGASDLEDPKGCWMSLKEQSHFEKMNQLEQKYKDAREAFAKDIDTEKFDQKMLDIMRRTRGIAERTLQKFDGKATVIPAGLNLGSYCMMRMPASVLFFYRLKLRNDTRFTVNLIHNDVEQLTLTLRLSLNDLHLIGQYERALTSREEPSRLFYRPNKGEVEFLLKDVKYKVEGRYRLLKDRLHIEHIISEIPPMQILMRYTTDNSGKSTPLDPNSLKDYLNRMQNNLDHWLKDYFNDFLMIYGLEDIKTNTEIQEYQNERTILLNEYADQVMDLLNARVRDQGPKLIMPDFMLTAVNGMEIKLYDGSVRGLDTMYRRSVTTGKLRGEVRHIDADIGFSGLKAEYRYDTYVKTGLPPVSGVFVLNSDDISAHMALQIVGYKPSVPDLFITYLNHGKPESLTVEGPANRIIANFNHLLEHHIISIMSSTLIHHIRSLSSLTECDPKLPTNPQTNEESGEQQTQSDNVNTEDNENRDITTPINSYDDDEPTEPPPDSDEATQQPENNDNDGPTEDNETPNPTENNNDYEPTEPPEDDRQTELPENIDDNGPTAPPDNNNYDEVTELPQYSDDDRTIKPPNPENNDDSHDKPEYAFIRKESVELELPPKEGAAKGESFKIDHNETFTLTKLNNDNSDDGKLNNENDADAKLNNDNNEDDKLNSNNDEEGKLSNDNDDDGKVAADDGDNSDAELEKKDYRGQIDKLRDSDDEY